MYWWRFSVSHCFGDTLSIDPATKSAHLCLHWKILRIVLIQGEIIFTFVTFTVTGYSFPKKNIYIGPIYRPIHPISRIATKGNYCNTYTKVSSPKIVIITVVYSESETDVENFHTIKTFSTHLYFFPTKSLLTTKYYTYIIYPSFIRCYDHADVDLEHFFPSTLYSIVPKEPAVYSQNNKRFHLQNFKPKTPKHITVWLWHWSWKLPIHINFPPTHQLHFPQRTTTVTSCYSQNNNKRLHLNFTTVVSTYLSYQFVPDQHLGCLNTQKTHQQLRAFYVPILGSLRICHHVWSQILCLIPSGGTGLGGAWWEDLVGGHWPRKGVWGCAALKTPFSRLSCRSQGSHFKQKSQYTRPPFEKIWKF